MLKKKVRNFLTNFNFFIFFKIFSDNFFKSLLRGKETTRKKYRIVFEKFTFFEKISKKSLKKKVRNFLTNLILFFSSFYQKMSLKLF